MKGKLKFLNLISHTYNMESNQEFDEENDQDDKENNYIFIKTIGKGSYGTVDEVSHKITGKIYVK